MMELAGLPYGLAVAGSCNSDMTPSLTAIVCGDLAGYGDDYFNGKFYAQVAKTTHELLTLDVAPAPADFAATATITGAASGKTCTVVAKLTSTTYIVKNRSGAFTDGEIVSDGTNSRDCGAGYPAFTSGPAPENEVQQVLDYVSATGTFTTPAFSQVVEPLDEILILHETVVSLGRNDADNAFDSSAVVKNRDGSILERTEFIIDALMGTQFRTEQSKSGTVEENAFEMFSISLFDLDSGAILSADINIAAITQVMEKSAGGVDFSSAGITQPVFAKADGRVYCSYQFKASEWAVGDLYRLTVTGITAVVDAETVYCQNMVWSNVVLEAAALDAMVEDIDADLGEPNDTETSTLHGKVGTDTEMADRSLYDILNGGGPAAFAAAANPANDVSLAAVLRAIVTSLTGGDDYDGYTNINNSANVSINAIAQKFAALWGADGANVFNPTIQGAARTDLDAALNILATYLSASAAAMSIQLNNQTARTNLEQALEDYFALVGVDGTNVLTNINNSANATFNAVWQKFAALWAADGANVFNPTIQGSARTDLEQALNALATYITPAAAAFSKQVNNYTLRTNLEDIIQDICAVIEINATNAWSTNIAGVTQNGIKTTAQAIGTALEKIYALTDGAGEFPASVVDNSIISKMLSKVAPGGDTSSYNNTTDSMEMLSDKLGAYSGDGGAAQDDSVKASLDLAHTDLDAILEDTGNLDTGLVRSGHINIIYPDVDQPLSAIEFDLQDINDDFIANGEITTVGQIDIYRYRQGTDANWTSIVAAGVPAGTGNGTLNYSYNFPNASWAIGDLVQIHMSGTQVTLGTKVFTIPRKTIYGIVGLNRILQDLKDGGRLDLLIDAILADTAKIDEATLAANPTAGSLARFIASGGTALGTQLPDSKSLYDAAAGNIDAVNRVAGKLQVKTTTIDLHQAAANYDLFTCTTQDVLLEKLTIRMPNINISDDVTITSISIQTDDATPQIIIPATLGKKANLTAEAQLGWSSDYAGVLLKVGKKVQLTINGGTADADPTTCDVVAQCRAVANGGYLS
jgi:hypothetical protein